MYLWRNGKIIELSEFTISPMDRGLMHGRGAFETMLYHEGNVQHWEYHWQRFMQAAGFFQLAVPVFSIQEIVQELCEKNHITGGARVRLSATAGESDGKNGVCWITVQSIESPKKSVSVKTLTDFSVNEHSALRSYKSACYAEKMLALQAAMNAQADEGLLLDSKGYVSECCTANVFFLSDKNELITPSLSTGCLPGVMRRVIIEKALKNDIVVREEQFTVKEARQFSHMFLSSSLRGLQNVHEWDGRVLELRNLKF